MRNTSLAVILVALALTGAGCITIGGSSAPTAVDGGVFRTADRGENWVQRVGVLSVGAPRSMADVTVTTMVVDPQDSRTMYVGTAENGLFYTYDNGDSWQQSPGLAGGRVSGITIHPKNKCVLLITTGNRLMRSDDCARTWTLAYPDPRPDMRLTALVIDWYNAPAFADRNFPLWLANAGGELMKSNDGGYSWAQAHSFGNEILRIFLSPDDTRRIYVATISNGIWRSDDGGVNWVDLSLKYGQFSGARDFRDLAISVVDPKTLVFANGFGIIRSRDYGETWDKIDLLTPPGTNPIYSLALDPKSTDIIYYGTNTSFIKSGNAGLNWVPKKLPTGRIATQLLVDSANSDILYMGTTKVKK